VSYAPQSSPGLLRLPACVIACLLLAAPLRAQEEQPLSTPADLQREPDGPPLVSLPAGAPVVPGRPRGDWHQVTVEGWITTSSTSPTRRDGFDLVVTPDRGENLRRAPNGPVLGRVREGTLLKRVGVNGRWTRVKRAGWVPRRAVGSAARPQPVQGKAPQARAPGAAPSASKGDASKADAPATDERVETARETNLSAVPEGGALATLPSGTPARVVSRSNGWARVQLEGWVKEDDLKASDGGTLVGVSAAEVRAAPDRYVGQTIDWRLQLIAVQTADELRTEMPAGQPYLLTRGPLPEPGFVYVTIPAGRIAEFRALPPLTEVVLRVTVRAARSKYLTTPVTELVSVVSGLDGK
jgi:hypothetical protein